MFTVQDFDGNLVPTLHVSRQLHLRKASLSDGFSQLVFPNHHPIFCYLHTHFSLFLCSFLIPFLTSYLCVHEAPTCLISCLKLGMIALGFVLVVRSWEYQWGASKGDMYGGKKGKGKSAEGPTEQVVSLTHSLWVFPQRDNSTFESVWFHLRN